MNEDTLYDVCDTFGLRSGMVYVGGKWGPHISISCPLAPINHGDPVDYNLSCSVSVSDTDPSLARCFSFNCGYKGSLFRALQQAVKHRGDPEILVELLDVLAPTEKFTNSAAQQRANKSHDAFHSGMTKPPAATVDRDLMPEGRFARYADSVPVYAINRGLTVETCKAWGLGHDKKRGCLVFPVRRRDGKLVGITGRYYIKDPPTKYHNYAGLNKTRYIYGEHMLEMNKPIIVCEGQIDAIITWQHLGLPTVASLGEGFSLAHTKMICNHTPPRVYLFLDNDQAGRMAAEKIEHQLNGRVPIKIMLPPPGMDPGELTKEEAQAAFTSAVQVSGKIVWD